MIDAGPEVGVFPHIRIIPDAAPPSRQERGRRIQDMLNFAHCIDVLNARATEFTPQQYRTMLTLLSSATPGVDDPRLGPTARKGTKIFPEDYTRAIELPTGLKVTVRTPAPGAILNIAPEELSKRAYSMEIGDGAHLSYSIASEVLSALAVGSGTSWNPHSQYIERHQVQWDREASYIAQMLTSGHTQESDPQRQETPYTAEEIIRQMHTLENDHKGLCQDMLRNLDEKLSRIPGVEPGAIDTKRTLLAASGADAVTAVLKQFAPPNHAGVLLDKGGVVSEKYLREHNGQLLHFQNDAEPKSPEILFQEIKKCIDEGEKVVVLPVVTKTGEIYVQLLEDVARYVEQYNSQLGNEPVFLAVDAVQALGRLDTAHVLNWIGIPGVSAFIHTGGKAPGGISQAGFIRLSEAGEAMWKKRKENNRQIFDEVQTEHRLAGSLCDGFSDVDLPMYYRAQSNIQAISDMVDLGPDYQLYSPLAETVRSVAVDNLKVLGFRVLEDAPAESVGRVTSIITFQLPEGMSNETAHEMLSWLATNGIILGGMIDAEPAENSFLRLSVPIEVMKVAQKNNLSPEQMRDYCTRLWSVVLSPLYRDAMRMAHQATCLVSSPISDQE